MGDDEGGVHLARAQSLHSKDGETGHVVTFPAATSASHASHVCQILRPCTVVRVSDLNSTLGIGSSIWMGAFGIPIRTTRPPFRSKLGEVKHA